MIVINLEDITLSQDNVVHNPGNVWSLQSILQTGEKETKQTNMLFPDWEKSTARVNLGELCCCHAEIDSKAS